MIDMAARERFRGCGSSLLRLGLSPPRSHFGRDLPRRVAARNVWRATPPPANRSGMDFLYDMDLSMLLDKKMKRAELRQSVTIP
jgi:hypothetical protein